MKWLCAVTVCVLAMDTSPGGAGANASLDLPGFQSASVYPLGAEPPTTEVVAGEDAPDFSFESPDGRWRRLKDLTGQGHVLLVFGADDAALRALERERERLMDRGITPVAVMDRRAGACWSAATRLQLRYTLVPDPQRVIAIQFNSLEPRTRRAIPAWFVVDRRGRVRGLDRRGLPATGYAAMAARALQLPSHDITIPAASH